MLLRHERRTILEAAAENVLAFDEAVYDLRKERMLTAAELKAAELKLLVLRQASTTSGGGGGVRSTDVSFYHTLFVVGNIRRRNGIPVTEATTRSRMHY